MSFPHTAPTWNVQRVQLVQRWGRWARCLRRKHRGVSAAFRLKQPVNMEKKQGGGLSILSLFIYPPVIKQRRWNIDHSQMVYLLWLFVHRIGPNLRGPNLTHHQGEPIGHRPKWTPGEWSGPLVQRRPSSRVRWDARPFATLSMVASFAAKVGWRYRDHWLIFDGKTMGKWMIYPKW